MFLIEPKTTGFDSATEQVLFYNEDTGVFNVPLTWATMPEGYDHAIVMDGRTGQYYFRTGSGAKVLEWEVPYEDTISTANDVATVVTFFVPGDAQEDPNLPLTWYKVNHDNGKVKFPERVVTLDIPQGDAAVEVVSVEIVHNETTGDVIAVTLSVVPGSNTTVTLKARTFLIDGFLIDHDTLWPNP